MLDGDDMGLHVLGCRVDILGTHGKLDGDDHGSFYTALVSALLSRLTALVCDSTRVTSFL